MGQSESGSSHSSFLPRCGWLSSSNGGVSQAGARSRCDQPCESRTQHIWVRRRRGSGPVKAPPQSPTMAVANHSTAEPEFKTCPDLRNRFGSLRGSAGSADSSSKPRPSVKRVAEPDAALSLMSQVGLASPLPEAPPELSPPCVRRRSLASAGFQYSLEGSLESRRSPDFTHHFSPRNPNLYDSRVLERVGYAPTGP